MHFFSSGEPRRIYHLSLQGLSLRRNGVRESLQFCLWQEGEGHVFFGRQSVLVPKRYPDHSTGHGLLDPGARPGI